MRSIVVVPTYNERENLARLAHDVLAIDPTFDVLVVDDGSPDGTGELADTLARELERVQVLHRPRKEGIGPAYLAGFDHALSREYEHIVGMDADFSHNPAHLPRLLAPLRAGAADLVLGSRWLPNGGTHNWPLHRQVLSRAGSSYARAVLSVSVRDLTTGFKAFHRRVLDSVELETVRCSGYGFQIELTYRALRAGFRVSEVPIVFAERAHGRSKMSSRIVAEALVLVWRLRLASLPTGVATREPATW